MKELRKFIRNIIKTNEKIISSRESELADMAAAGITMCLLILAKIDSMEEE